MDNHHVMQESAEHSWKGSQWLITTEDTPVFRTMKSWKVKQTLPPQSLVFPDWAACVP